MGGEARAKKLSKARRIEIARNAGLARWKLTGKNDAKNGKPDKINTNK